MMKKIAIVSLAVIVLLGIAVAGFRLGWWSRIGPGSATPVSGQPNASTPGSGTPGSAGVEELPPGIYKVVVQAGEQTVVADRVEVALGGQTILRIVMKDGRLALQR
jgi:hypothetical protein